MELEVQNLESGVLLVKLGPRLDLEASTKLENPFTFRVACAKAAVVVDLSSVEFIASIGIRLLLRNAKAQQNRGGKLVLYKPTPMVREVLTMTGVGSVIAVHDDFDEACRDALAGLSSASQRAGPG
jgi:anti-anti-sigma factor